MPGNFSRVEDDAGHASTLKNREAMYAFFQEHLKNPGNPKDEEIVSLTKEELQVTPTGQVSTSVGGETVFSLNMKDAEKLSANLDERRKNPGFLHDAVNSARKLSGYADPSGTGDPVFTGRVLRNNYVIEKYFVKGEGNYVIPYLLFRPSNAGNKTVIYLHPEGKSAEAMVGGEIEEIVSQGITVLAPDLVGTGETGPGSLRGDAYFKGVSHNLWYASMLVGRSITGIQAGDVSRLVRIVKTGNANAEIIGFSRKEMAPVILHAAAFNDDISKVILLESYTSWHSVVLNRFYDPVLIMSSVPGALKDYDLPDLAAFLSPRRLAIVTHLSEAL
jgi:hypothetical protein